MDKHIRKATGIKPYKVVDPQGNEWWAVKLDPNQKYEFPDLPWWPIPFEEKMIYLQYGYTYGID